MTIDLTDYEIIHGHTKEDFLTIGNIFRTHSTGDLYEILEAVDNRTVYLQNRTSGGIKFSWTIALGRNYQIFSPKGKNGYSSVIRKIKQMDEKRKALGYRW